jgi:hypothetical protein
MMYELILVNARRPKERQMVVITSFDRLAHLVRRLDESDRRAIAIGMPRWQRIALFFEASYLLEEQHETTFRGSIYGAGGGWQDAGLSLRCGLGRHLGDAKQQQHCADEE